MPTSDDPAQRIAILILPSFSNLTLAAVMEPLRGANRWAGRALFEWSSLSKGGDAVVSSSFLRVVPNRSLDALDAFDALFVVASFDAERHTSPASSRSSARPHGAASWSAASNRPPIVSPLPACSTAARRRRVGRISAISPSAIPRSR